MKRALAALIILLSVPPSVIMTGRMIWHLKQRNYILACLYGIAIIVWGGLMIAKVREIAA